MSAALVTLKAWPEDATRALRSLPEPDPAITPAWYRSEWEAGRLRLWGVDCLGERVGYVLTRVDEDSTGAEGVIVAAAARAPGVDLTALFLPVLARWFQAEGCRAARFHTRRRGLVAKAARLGFRPAETVCRMDFQ